jgi:exodeoxyribonuclease VII large subunit
MENAKAKIIPPFEDKLEGLGRMLETLSYKSVLNRGYAVLRDDKNQIVSDIATVKKSESITVEVKDGMEKVR